MIEKELIEFDKSLSLYKHFAYGTITLPKLATFDETTQEWKLKSKA